MAKVKVVGTNLDQNLNGINFNNTASETIFQFGSFTVTSNFSGRIYINYTNTLSSFVRPVTLETMGLNNTQSSVIHDYQTNATLNLDKSNLNTFVRFGSTYEFFRVSVQKIILGYPGSLFVNTNAVPGGNQTFNSYIYNSATDITTIQIPTVISSYNVVQNTFGLVFNQGNVSEPNDMAISNLNLSYDKYVVWSTYDLNTEYPVIGFTGDTAGVTYITIKTRGNPFWFNTGSTNRISFHIKPSSFIFEEYRSLLTSYEQYIISQRVGGISSGFQFIINDPTLMEDGSISYATTTMLWTTSDGYNIDINDTEYQNFLTALLAIGSKYDSVKTDLIARFLTPTSIKIYDLTEDGKMTKLLRVYGWEFDQLRKFIDSLVNINTVTYNKLNNIPDQLVSNLARTFGWNYFSLVNENELVQNFLSINNVERDLTTDFMPGEVNIELWRRILMNANYFWKSKGTREAIKSIFLLIGIPEPFINITEYVYTVGGKINPNTVPFTTADFPNNSLPYDNSGYPKAPIESPTFYFQISGDTDSGQAYMNNFRKAGFSLTQIVDNKKSWIQTGATTRIHYDTPQYVQQDSKLVLNTKEVDVALDTARGIEYDVYNYINTVDFPANSSGYTLPYSYINVSLGYTGAQNTFTLPTPYNKTEGTLEVRFNGILLNAPTEYSGATGPIYNDLSHADYSVTGNSFTILNGNYAQNLGNRRDVIQATFIYSGGSHPVTGITVEYIVTRIKPNLIGTTIPLPSYPRGDVQVTINGIALTKGTPQFVADYIVDPNNSISGQSNIIIQNPEIIAYLAAEPNIQVAYVHVLGSNEINARSEVVRVDSFNSGKVYFNVSANKYVYKMNYRANQASDIKVLVDGIALEPYKDYDINVLNKYEVFLPSGIRYGSVISVYYLVAQSSYFNPIISDVFGVGDISKLSFLEFIELIQRKLINVRTRKIVSDYKGGWYPALLNVYMQYLKRSLLPENDPLHSNGYTFENLYPFLSKYNSFFQKFVDELLSATIILRQGGLLIRNTVFTKQKFMYKRGVNLYSGNSTTIDMRNMPIVQYLGDDGSMFMIHQQVQQPQPIPPTFYVDTISGTTGIGSIINTGGMNIQNYNLLTSYGVQYRCNQLDPWSCVSELGAPTVDNYSMSINGLLENTTYTYQAFVLSGPNFALGQLYSGTTLATPIIPGLFTKLGTASATTINSGGIAITGGSSASWYGMQYRVLSAVTYSIQVNPIVLNVLNSGATQCVYITGDSWNCYTVTCSVPWILTLPSNHGTPSPTGALSQITACVNIGVARSGIVCYTPLTGSTKYVTVNQACGVSPYKAVNFLCCEGGYSCELCAFSIGALATQPPMSAGETYNTTFNWNMRKPITSCAPELVSVELTCNGFTVGSCSCGSKGALNCTGTWGPFTVHYGDVFNAFACARAETIIGTSSSASVAIFSVVSGNGCFCLGEYPYMMSVYAQTCSTCTPPLGPIIEV